VNNDHFNTNLPTLSHIKHLVFYVIDGRHGRILTLYIFHKINIVLYLGRQEQPMVVLWAEANLLGQGYSH